MRKFKKGRNMDTQLRIMYDAQKQSFAWVKGGKVEDFKPQYISGNGWVCRIRADGSIDCKTSEIREGKYFKTHFCINKIGRVTISRHKDRARFQEFSRRIRNWPVNGLLILGGGKAEERNAFFKCIKSEKEEN